MKSKSFSESVSAACIIALCLLVCATKCAGQTWINDAEGKGIIVPDTLFSRYFISGLEWNPVYRPVSNAILIQTPDFITQPPEKVKRCNALDFSEYPRSIDGKTLSTWALFAGAGVMWGAREAYHAEATVFERRLGVSSLSFWGSEAWKRNYWHNDPDAGHKPEYIGNVGRDVWHTFGFGSKAFIVTGTIAITSRKQPVKYRVVNLLAGLAIQSATASLTYNLLRR